jgi:aspartate kinase
VCEVTRNGDMPPAAWWWWQEWPQTELSYEREIAKLSVRGIGLRSHTGVGEKMFAALAEANVNVGLLNTSEILMSVIVAKSDGDKAFRALQAAFELAYTG